MEMTLTLGQLLPYVGAMAILVWTPGPVVAALIARAATGGVAASVPLALGVAVGDFFWPLAAMLGIGAITGFWGGFLTVLRYAGAAMLLWMGFQMIRHAEARAVKATSGLARESGWSGFVAGLMAIAGNPKAILFYVGVLPGFFDFRVLTPLDMAVICAVSMLIPFLANLAWATLFARARAWLADPLAMRRTHIVAGALLMGVGAAIALG